MPVKAKKSTKPSPKSEATKVRKSSEISEKGKQRKKEIVEATLQVIVQSGVQGVTHRAVAQEAGVQLRLTTYYFKDKEDLINEAFIHFAENGKSLMANFLELANEHLEKLSASERKNLTKQSRQKIYEVFAEIASDYLIHSLKHERDHIAVQQAFLNEAIENPLVRELHKKHRARLIENVIEVCKIANKTDPEIEAEIFVNAFEKMEHEGICTPVNKLDKKKYRAMVHKLIWWMIMR
ncbi:MAG: TetR family transcriptional regulator [Pseudomonadales bacterium]|nr:TetR family transcriptional regulator [Pseudomonadales bacterium]